MPWGGCIQCLYCHRAEGVVLWAVPAAGTRINHEPDYGFLVDTVTWVMSLHPLFLAESGFSADGEFLEPWLSEAMMHITSLSNVHKQTLILLYSGKTTWRTKGLVCRSYECCIPRTGFSLNITDNLETGRKRWQGSTFNNHDQGEITPHT